MKYSSLRWEIDQTRQLLRAQAAKMDDVDSPDTRETEDEIRGCLKVAAMLQEVSLGLQRLERFDSP